MRTGQAVILGGVVVVAGRVWSVRQRRWYHVEKGPFVPLGSA